MHKTNFITITRSTHIWVILLLVIGQSACSPHKVVKEVPSVAKIPPRELPPDPMPRTEPRSRYGNPSSYVVFGKRYYTLSSSYNFVERGIASWYGKKFHGKRTSSGERYNMYAMTAAHTRLPLPTHVQVTNLKNGRKVVVRVNDRGPFYDNRIIDLSYSAAAKLGILREGTSLVEVRALNALNYHAARESNAAMHSADRWVEKSPARMMNASAVDTRVFVQVGAFSTRAGANRLTRQLGDMNLGTITISSVTRGEAKLYQVRIGPLPTIQSADETITKLYDMGMREHHVVIE